MARRYYSSIAQRTTLTADINSSVTTMAVAAVVGWPATFPYTLIIDQDTINEEIVTVTNRSGTTLTVTRGSDGSTAVSHTSGAAVNHGVSARDFDEPNAFINGTAVVTASMINSETATVGQALVANGTGGAEFGAAVSAGGGFPDIFLLMGA